MITALILAFGAIAISLAVVGNRAIDNAERLFKAMKLRLGFPVKKMKTYPAWIRFLAFFWYSLLCPFVGGFMLFPSQRRFMLANIALGMARVAAKRGALNDQQVDELQDAFQSWVDLD